MPCIILALNMTTTMMSLITMTTTTQNKEKKKRNKKEISLLKVVLYVQVRKGMYKNLMAKIWKQILSCYGFKNVSVSIL